MVRKARCKETVCMQKYSIIPYSFLFCIPCPGFHGIDYWLFLYCRRRSGYEESIFSKVLVGDIVKVRCNEVSLESGEKHSWQPSHTVAK